LLLYWGRGQTLGGDELHYAYRLSAQSLGHAMLYPPPDGYLIAAPLAVYKGLFETAGLGAYWVHRLVAVALVLACAVLFWAVARRAVGDLRALAPTVLLLLFGYGSEMVLTAERIPGLMALAAGLGALAALGRRSPRRVAAAALLLALSLASHPIGVAFAAGVAVLVLARPSPARWRAAWIFAAPAALYAAWWLLLRPPGHNPAQTRLAELASFVGQSWTAATAAISGLAGVLDGPAYHHALGWLAAALLAALGAAGVVAGRRRLPARFWAAAAALLTLWIATGSTRGNALLIALRPADLPRYVFPGSVLMLLMLVELAGALRLPSRAWLAATGVLALGLVANVDRLEGSGERGRRLSDYVRAALGATELAAPAVRPGYYPLGFFYGDAGSYLAAVRAFGSMGYSPAELGTRPEATRLAADTTLIAAERLGLKRAPSHAPGRGTAPRLAAAFQGRPQTARGCLVLRPGRGSRPLPPRAPAAPPGPSAGLPALAEVTARAPGVSVHARRPGRVAIAASRFADPPGVPLRMPRSSSSASLAIPADGAAIPWRLTVYSAQPVSLCALASPAR